MKHNKILDSALPLSLNSLTSRPDANRTTG